MKNLLLILLCLPLIGFGQTSEEYINRGYAAYELDNFEKAIDDYTQAIKIDPDAAAAYEGRGDAYF